VDIQRQVGTVHGHVVFPQSVDQFPFAACPWVLCVPKQAMVYDHQVGTDGGSLAHGGQTGVYTRGQFLYLTGVLYLQAVVCAGVIVNGIKAKFVVTVFHDGVQVDGRHAVMKPQTRPRANFFTRGLHSARRFSMMPHP